jgi:Flp pilus assembly protein TadD
MTKIQCPIATCRAENDLQATVCICCNAPLQGYTRLLFYPAKLFNEGLVAARNGRLRQARDLFAGVVQWCPKDIEARNALAMACFALKDWSEARRQWEAVQAQSLNDPIAQLGLASLEEREQKAVSSTTTRRAKPKHKARPWKQRHPR